MNKAIIYGIGGVLIGVVGGAYMGAKTVCHVIGIKIRENGGAEKLNEFTSMLKTKEEPN